MFCFDLDVIDLGSVIINGGSVYVKIEGDSVMIGGKKEKIYHGENNDECKGEF